MTFRSIVIRFAVNKQTGVNAKEHLRILSIDISFTEKSKFHCLPDGDDTSIHVWKSLPLLGLMKRYRNIVFYLLLLYLLINVCPSV